MFFHASFASEAVEDLGGWQSRDPASGRANSARMRWLTCLVGSTRVFIPTAAIKLIVEYDVGPPPPLASPYLAGLGLLEERLALSVRVGFRPTVRTRRTKGILFLASTETEEWAFEVDSVLGFAADEPSDLLPSEPAWLARTRLGDRYLDVEAMRAALGGGAPR